MCTTENHVDAPPEPAVSLRVPPGMKQVWLNIGPPPIVISNGRTFHSLVPAPVKSILVVRNIKC